MESNTKIRLASLMAMAAMAEMAAASQVSAVPERRQKENKPPADTKRVQGLAAEIAEHNAAVDRRKAEKKAAKLARRRAQNF